MDLNFQQKQDEGIFELCFPSWQECYVAGRVGVAALRLLPGESHAKPLRHCHETTPRASKVLQYCPPKAVRDVSSCDAMRTTSKEETEKGDSDRRHLFLPCEIIPACRM